ncbi:MAG: ABC transporter permease [Terracidiphilus sp.]
MMTELLTRLWFLVLRKKPSELDEELRFHLEQSIAMKQAAGLNASEARREALIEFGGMERTREQCAKQRPGWWLDTAKRDLRHGLRILRKSPGLMSVAVVTLALGIGANTAIFSLVDGISLRPLPIADPSHLVAIKSVKNRAAADAEGTDSGSSYGEFSDVRERVPAFSDVAAADRRGMVFQTADGLQLLLAEVVSDNYFTFMGVRPEVGRLPDESELHSLQSPIVVLSHGTWKRIFGGNPGVIGQTIKVKGGFATVLAVLPAGFRGTERLIDPQVYVPQSSWVMWAPDERNTPRTVREFELYARLRPGATLSQAAGQLQVLSADLAAKYPQANSGRSFTADWQTKAEGGGLQVLSILVLAIAGAVLLIACTNVANLLLALNDSRRREIAMRAALGATRGMLLRQLVTEYAVLAAFGVAGALVLAQRLISMVPALLPDIGYPLGFDFRIDHRVLAFTAAAGIVSVLVCGLLPALAMMRTSPLDAMRTQLPHAGKLRMPARKVFAVTQLAISMSLLIATGLLVRALIHIENMDLGFNSGQNAILLGIGVGGQGSQRQAEFDTLVTRMKALPGVKDASVARVVPFPDSGGGATQVVLAPGEVPSETAGTPVWFNSIDDGYFRLMSVPLVRGRAFGTQDTAVGSRVVIVNQTLAKKLFGTADVVGRHVRLGRKEPLDAEVVGVTRDGKYADLDEAPQPYLYLPLSQDDRSEVTLIVTTAGDAGELLPVVRKSLQQTSSSTLIINTQTLTDHMRFVTYTNRMAAWLTASLGGLALLLTTLGLYGVTAYSVSRRTHEIGIRMALGALRETVFARVLTDGLKLTVAGMVLGTCLAMLLGRGMSSLLYGVKPSDPITWLVVATLVISTSLAALIVPARRALRTDPVEALREE